MLMIYSLIYQVLRANAVLLHDMNQFGLTHGILQNAIYQLLDTAIGTLRSGMEQPAPILYTTAGEIVLSATNIQLSLQV